MIAVITGAAPGLYLPSRREDGHADDNRSPRDDGRARPRLGEGSLSALVKFILETHHAFTRAAIATLPPLAATVRERHGDLHPETRASNARPRLRDLGRTCQEERILFHISRVENDVLFPRGDRAGVD